MKYPDYKKQVALLIDVIPEIAKEEDIALHGGTAINLFVRDMPRVSVDIDLTYLPIQDRDTTLIGIKTALVRISNRISKLGSHVFVDNRKIDSGKLFISRGGVIVKLEVNLIMRGSLFACERTALCKKAEETYGAYCEIRVIPKAQLYGGKICAALDRQHPRDYFDVKYILSDTRLDESLKHGFLYCLLSNERPIQELLRPNLLDQSSAFEKQFSGMTGEPFSYNDFQVARNDLIESINRLLTDSDKHYILNFVAGKPDWSLYNFQHFPSIQWKLLNLEKLKNINPTKYNNQYKTLEKVLFE
ncbi:MAG: nucleotidyl transferase AbiEii/AbiGii toxin family protein [Saprospiraceae bacterium]|nr:MAG: nucleotidyl transferase AbiEii/AbiGii toxin family protein [Saprospiraceae bacterium]